VKPAEYIQNALKTETLDYEKTARLCSDQGLCRLLHAVYGLSTESGELLDQFKRHIYYGQKLDLVNVEEEMGDIFWYLAILADQLGVSFEQVMEKNIAKLKARYGEKFSQESALQRDLKNERDILEQK
jgi:NTP pyrophosphatase (non-canonical NTP hydrolase)